MEKNLLRRISFSSSSSSTLANFKLKKNNKKENKKWEWLDLSDTTKSQRLNKDTDTCSERDRKDDEKRDDEEGEDEDNEALMKNWSTIPFYDNTQQGLNGEQERDNNRSTNPSSSASYFGTREDSNHSSDFSHDLVYKDFDDSRLPGSFGSQNPHSFSKLSTNSPFPGGFMEKKPARNNRINSKIGFDHRTNTAFTSSNIYLRPLPATFTPLDLHELCMSMVRISNREKNKKFHILSVKVMIEEEDKAALGTCKGFGFCLWNSVQASTACIEGLRAHGYQASFARESSRAMLSSLADPTSANIYLSNLPHHWGEDQLKELFGDIPIASARLLRDRDEEAVGSGASRGVGFVRLACRSDALHFVELLHGMPIPGTNCHLQCRMADSQAQKEWKRNIRSSFKQPSSSADGSLEKNQSPDSAASHSSKKWSIKKPTHHIHPNVPSVITPDRQGSVVNSPHQNMPPSYNEPGLDGIRGGSFHVVGLGSPGGPMLMPPFHAPSRLPGHGPIITATNNRLSPTIMAPTGNEIQRIFPIAPAFFPVYPPTWYPQQGCPGLSFSPGSNYSSMNTSPYAQNWSNGPYDHHSNPPTPSHQKSFGYYYPDSSFPTLLPQNEQLNDLHDSNRSLNLNTIDPNSSDRLTQPITSRRRSVEEFYSTGSNIKISDEVLTSNPIIQLENNREEEKQADFK